MNQLREGYTGSCKPLNKTGDIRSQQARQFRHKPCAEATGTARKLNSRPPQQRQEVVCRTCRCGTAAWIVQAADGHSCGILRMIKHL
jgi:hypothetical protein